MQIHCLLIQTDLKFYSIYFFSRYWVLKNFQLFTCVISKIRIAEAHFPVPGLVSVNKRSKENLLVVPSISILSFTSSFGFNWIFSVEEQELWSVSIIIKYFVEGWIIKRLGVWSNGIWVWLKLSPRRSTVKILKRKQ